MILLYDSTHYHPRLRSPRRRWRRGVVIRTILQHAFQNWRSLDRLAPSKLNCSPQEIWLLSPHFVQRETATRKHCTSFFTPLRYVF
ncbi:GM26544 [Drosophila sechellia]|uniref:GM26544 n=1 Tax=Drosophila sechellia TaxID=7238 RepID=B4HG16_DROSE|nr:GM26544 [Drosophila sechellia]